MTDFTFNFTESQLAQILPGNKSIKEWYAALCKFLPEYNINTPLRVAAFVAQCAHESANFTVLKENLNYSAGGLMKTWPTRFSNQQIADQYARQPEKIANRVYSSRMGNGVEASGDGWRYAGKGLIQLTGKENYTRFADTIDKTPEAVSDYLLTVDGAVESACWFWNDARLNPLADAGDIVTITRRINGGENGLADRKKHYEHALVVLGGSSVQSIVAESALDLNTVIRRGSRGTTVAAVQAKLGLVADGDFGSGTERALIQWQSDNSLVADGVAGPKTLSKLLG